MSGTKTSRADLKNRFKKGMYPTEGDFANVFESYVHKDDDISMSKVVLTDGDGNTTTLNNVIGNKADKTDLTEITNRLTTAENDIDTAEDNIAGHETRLQGLEAFKERVRAFLEDADASEETINRWHEIESFLQGITDTQTLTGLLNDLKQEILQSIPQSQQGNYLQLINDLDAYTDAPVGTIVKYTGPSTDKYTHGFDYERKAGNGSGAKTITITKTYDNILSAVLYGKTFSKCGETQFSQYDHGYWMPSTETVAVGTHIYQMTGYPPMMDTITSVTENSFSISRNSTSSLTPTRQEMWELYEAPDGTQIYVYQDAVPNSYDYPYYIVSLDSNCAMGKGDVTETIDTPSTWQLIPSMPVIQ